MDCYSVPKDGQASRTALGNGRVAKRRREGTIVYQSPCGELSLYSLPSRGFPGTVLVWKRHPLT
jgi:hypothetical protein